MEIGATQGHWARERLYYFATLLLNYRHHLGSQLVRVKVNVHCATSAQLWQAFSSLQSSDGYCLPDVKHRIGLAASTNPPTHSSFWPRGTTGRQCSSSCGFSLSDQRISQPSSQ